MKQVRLFDLDNRGFMAAASFYMDLPFNGDEHFTADFNRRVYVVSWDDGVEEVNVEWNM